MNEKKEINENIIVAIISAILIVLLLTFVGYNNIKSWLFSPIIWNDPDYITMTLIDKEENRNMELTFSIKNDSPHTFSDYEFFVSTGLNILEIHSTMKPDLNPYSTTIIKVSFTEKGDYGKFYKALKGRDVSNIKLNYHVKSLTAAKSLIEGYETVIKDKETIVDNSSWFKVVAYIIIFVISGFLGFKNIVKTKWLRMALKVVCAPGLLIILIILIFAVFGDSESSKARVDADKKKKAAEEYKRQANLKAGALMHGNTKNAALAQAKMDKAMADMITGSTNSTAKESYKRQASLKAGALMHGNAKDAALAQAQMDKSMADMLNNLDKNK